MRKFTQLIIAMIYQNIVVIIAIGVLRVIFGDYGWFNNEVIMKIVNPVYHTLLPILIAHTGGRLTGGQRGGAVAAIATFSLTLSSSVAVILGAMLIGPFSGWVVKKVDQFILKKLPGAGYELLIGNILTAFIALFFMLITYLLIGKLFSDSMEIAILLLKSISDSSWLPLVAIIIEPVKVLFFNNLINFGMLAPLGIQQANEIGKSIFFLIESNPGPGLGVLLAYWIKTRQEQRQAAKLATSIHFLGGIHEVYFPYILRNIWLIIPLIFGGMVGIFVFQWFNVGLVSISSPGSVFLVVGLSPKHDMVFVLLGVALSALASFLISMLIVKRSIESPTVQETKNTIDEFYQIVSDPKSIKSNDNHLTKKILKNKKGSKQEKTNKISGEVRTIFFVCEAGIGSSAMGAAMLRKKLQQEGIGIDVENTSISHIPDYADLIVCHEQLLYTIQEAFPNKICYSLRSFTDLKVYDGLIQQLKKGKHKSL